VLRSSSDRQRFRRLAGMSSAVMGLLLAGQVTAEAPRVDPVRAAAGFVQLHKEKRLIAVENVNGRDIHVVTLEAGESPPSLSIFDQLSLLRYLVKDNVEHDGLYIRDQRIEWFGGMIATFRSGIAYGYEITSGLWVSDPANKESSGFVHVFSIATNLSIAGAPPTRMNGVTFASLVRYLRARGMTSSDISTELSSINKTFEIGLADANGNLLNNIQQFVDFYMSRGEVGTLCVTRQFITMGTEKVYMNVAELNGKLYVGQSANLVDVATFLTDAKHHDLAKELLTQAAGGNMLFAAQVVWTVGWNLKGNVAGDLAALLQKLGTPPVQSPSGMWGITFEDGTFGIVAGPTNIGMGGTAPGSEQNAPVMRASCAASAPSRSAMLARISAV
jgi:hypothetical protein